MLIFLYWYLIISFVLWIIIHMISINYKEDIFSSEEEFQFFMTYLPRSVPLLPIIVLVVLFRRL